MKRSNRPMPWSSCTTWSPGFRSERNDPIWTRLRRRSGCRGLRNPKTSASVNTRRPSSGTAKPSASGTRATTSEPDAGTSSTVSRATAVTSRSARSTQSRRERVHAGRVPTLAERIDEPPVRREVGTVPAIGTRESIPAGAVEALRECGRGLEGELARGKDDELFEGHLRSLRHRVKRTQRLDLVAEELDARGLLRRSGVDVDDAAAPRERARLVHFRHRLVPKIEEPRRGLRPRQPVARAKRAAAAGKLIRGDRVLEQRTQAGDDGDRGLSRRETPECQEPLMHRRPGRSARLEGHRLALREREDAIFAEPS